MSGDLISKDVLLEDIRNNITECSGIMGWLKLINSQPVAYDVDKVVEQLEDEKGIAFLTLANTGDKVKDAVYDEVIVYLNTAIEIVKAGGVK